MTVILETSSGEGSSFRSIRRRGENKLVATALEGVCKNKQTTNKKQFSLSKGAYSFIPVKQVAAMGESYEGDTLTLCACSAMDPAKANIALGPPRNAGRAPFACLAKMVSACRSVYCVSVSFFLADCVFWVCGGHLCRRGLSAERPAAGGSRCTEYWHLLILGREGCHFLVSIGLGARILLTWGKIKRGRVKRSCPPPHVHGLNHIDLWTCV